ncbi:DUF4832 domain-containing protein [Novipirellula artificiosorum]|uniref:Uncharacterized protein n=1 Tax=Novipirellula artificiosorum TaxID=2528016 RepID=A0A5C6D1X5_9BACT|nr:DUF4832 domain-containing protein [Novipirellula artificiosorum]TWU31183.1 hypothetical protein Poly41_63740 [Novipirellula artificiosorum]
MSPTGWESAPADVKALFEDAARRVGYRFVLTQIRVPEQINLRSGTCSRLLLEHTWKNTGVAPCHDSFTLDLQEAP